MTLVMRDQPKAYSDESYRFDPEEYNYVINRKTCFTCDNLIGSDYEKLEFILRKMKETYPELLEQLSYYYYSDDSDVG